MAIGQSLVSHRKTLVAVGAVVLVPLAIFAVIVALLLRTAEYREEATRWGLQGVSDDGRTLTIQYGTFPSCEGLDRVEKSETATKVALRVVTRLQITNCESEGKSVFHETEVELGRPLGERELVDARTGEPPNINE